MRKTISFILLFCMLLSVVQTLPVAAQNTVEYAWKLVEIIDQKNEDGWALYDGGVWKFDRKYERGTFYVRVWQQNQDTYFAYGTKAVWSVPPAIIKGGEKVTLTLDMFETENTHKGNTSGSSANADFAPVGLGLGTRGYDLFSNEDGIVDIALNGATISAVSETMTGTAPKAGYNGENRIALRVSYHHGTGFATYYVYEWQPYKPLEVGENRGESFTYGNRLMWREYSGIGYRLYRSENPNEQGVSVTDFYITGHSFADVNVNPAKTYYYTVKPVLTEADPLKGITEQLGQIIATLKVTAGSEAKAADAKQFILMQMDNPKMSVNGLTKEVDPGRGTVPMIISSRTMVPIRAIVEAMGGSIKWDNIERKITMTARGNTVEMWIGKTEMRINGVAKTMDVAPVIQNERTYVPVRFAAENLNAQIDWINSTREAVIIFASED